MHSRTFGVGRALCAAMVLAACGTMASADVFDMGGTRDAYGHWTGLASLETVLVGNPDNLPDGGASGPGQVDHVFAMGKYEVTAGQYCEFLNAVAATSDTYGLYHPDMADTDYWSLGCNIQRQWTGQKYAYSVPQDWANRPVNLVSWGDAARFANWLHNGQPTGMQDGTTTEDGAYFLNGAVSADDLLAVTRKPDARWAIPTSDEWYKAAYHKNDGPTDHYFKYPVSADTASATPTVEDPDPGHTYTGAYDMYGLGSPFGIGEPYFRSVVGERENSASPYGTFDQAGNVSEWTEEVISGWAREFRGGSFGGGGVQSDSLLAYDMPNYQQFSLGFRVVNVPEPATVVALLGAMAALARRRR